MTSDSQRHRYFAGRLANSFEVVGAFVESKQYKPEESCETSEDREVLARWFAMREAAETRFFAREAQEFSANARERMLRVDAGKINTPEIVERLRTLSPEVVAVFGSSLIRAELLGAVKKPFVNMHLGLSPYYRGSGTNFWPFYNGEIQYVGVTIHFIDLGIDSGDIVHQGRPGIDASDNPHTIGCKTIVVGTELMLRTLREVESGTAVGVPQEKARGRLFRRKDFTAEHVRVVLQRMRDGMIEEYARQPVSVEMVS